MKLGFLALMFVGGGLAAAPACAQTYEVKGAGTDSCGSWTADRQADQDSAIGDEEWVLGYVSARNQALMDQSGKTVSITTDAPGIFGWMDNYCKANPTVHMAGAAETFWETSGTIVKSGK